MRRSTIYGYQVSSDSGPKPYGRWSKDCLLPVSEQIWVALIGAAALLAAGFLGYWLRGRAQRAAQRRETLQAQLDRVYGPIYYRLKDATPPDEPLSEIDDEEVEKIIQIARTNGKLLEPQLEAIIDSMVEDLWTRGGVSDRDLWALWRHVSHRYHNLKKALGLPHIPHWSKLPLSVLYKEVRSWWWGYTWKREKRRKARRSRRAH